MKPLNILEDDLLTETHALLLADKRSLPVIASEAEVNYHWLGKFNQDKYEDPGVKKIQKLYAYLVTSINSTASN